MGPRLKNGWDYWREDGAAPTVLPLCNSKVIFLLILLVQGKYSWALGAPASPLLLGKSVRGSSICLPDSALSGQGRKEEDPLGFLDVSLICGLALGCKGSLWIITKAVLSVSFQVFPYVYASVLGNSGREWGIKILPPQIASAASSQ